MTHHRYPVQPIPVCIQQLLRKAASLGTEDKIIVHLIARGGIGLDPALGEIEQMMSAAFCQKILPRRVHAEIDEFPVVEAGALQMFVVDLEAKRFDQMKRREGGRAKPSDAAGVRRNFRFVQNDVHLRIFKDESYRSVVD